MRKCHNIFNHLFRPTPAFSPNYRKTNYVLHPFLLYNSTVCMMLEVHNGGFIFLFYLYKVKLCKCVIFKLMEIILKAWRHKNNYFLHMYFNI